MSESKVRVAQLFGGPADKVKMPLKGTEEAWGDAWPHYLCLNMKEGLARHYILVSGGVYEYAAVCAEFDHSPKEHVARCPDCAAQILATGHPEHGR